MGVLDNLRRKVAPAARSAAGQPVSVRHSSGLSVPLGVVDWDKVRAGHEALTQDPEIDAALNLPSVSYAELADPWYSSAGGIRRALEMSGRYADSDPKVTAAVEDARSRLIDRARSGDVSPDSVGAYVHDLADMGPQHLAVGLPGITPTAAYAQRRILPLSFPQKGTRGSFDSRMPDAFQVDEGLISGAADAYGALQGTHIGDIAHSSIEDLLQADSTAGHESVHAAGLGAPSAAPVYDLMGWGPHYNYKSAAKALGVPPMLRMLGRAFPNVLPGRRGLDHLDYLHEFAEMDARLPAVRRMFAYNTGRSVKNAQDAEAAWRWYGRNARHMNPARGLTGDQYDVYDSLSPRERAYMMARMALIPSLLLAPTAMSQTEEGLAP